MLADLQETIETQSATLMFFQGYIQHSGPLLSYLAVSEAVLDHTRIFAEELGCRSTKSADIKVRNTGIARKNTTGIQNNQSSHPMTDKTLSIAGVFEVGHCGAAAPSA